MSESRGHWWSMDAILRALRRRQRTANGFRHASHGLLAGCLLALLTALALAVALRLVPTAAHWPGGVPWLSLLWLPAGTAGGLIVGLFCRVDSLRVARCLDRAADSQDRFASAFQLAGHRRAVRAGLIVADALAAVSRTTARTAIPLRASRGLRWFPAVAAALLLCLLLAPGPRLEAQTAPAPEVTPDQWDELQRELRDEIAQLPPPQTEEEREVVAQLERLAELMARRPDKAEALAELARLRSELEQRRSAFAPGTLSLNDAANAVQSSQALEEFASQFRKGDYRRAAESLRALAEKLASGEMRPTAADFEGMAADFEQMAQRLAPHQPLGSACQRCAGAAGSLNAGKLSEAMKDLASTIESNNQGMCQYQQCCKAGSALDKLLRKLNRTGRCAGCANGCSSCRGSSASSMFLRRSNKQGGLKAGWGTADHWGGGALPPEAEERLADVIAPRESPGAETSTTGVSTREEAQSAQEFRDQYAELVRKAEAELDLEMVPIAYRDYLRRYFRAIRPDQAAPEPGP